MDKAVQGKTLLVGEGDFSFTVAMVTKHPVTSECEVMTTSIENADSITKHRNAAENMELLKKKGVRVILEVDATRLGEHPVLRAEKFSRILFNFPHAGGKSNHKKNRKLLNDFFGSAVSVLEDDGQILVTLCKGQGGTPADQPMRAWHDSWQVVSMAANAGLILVRADPFRVEDYETYTSTGFRSLDKGFHTDNAITHVFEKADPVKVPDDVLDCNVRVENETFSCSSYIYNKLQIIRELETRSHPFNQVLQHLTQMFSSGKESLEQTSDTDSSKTGISLLSKESESINSAPENLPDHICEEEIDKKLSDIFSCNFQTDKHYSLKKVSNGRLDSSLTIPSEYICPTAKEICDKGLTKNNHAYNLRTSLLDNCTFRNMSAENWPYIKTGPVFRSCLILTGQLPVQYQMLLICQAFKSVYEPDRAEEECSEVEVTRTVEVEDKVSKEVSAGISEIQNICKNLDLSSGILVSSQHRIEANNSGDAKSFKHAVYAYHADAVYRDFITERTIENLKKIMGEHVDITFHTSDMMKVNMSHNFKKVSSSSVDLVPSRNYGTSSTFQKTQIQRNLLGYFVIDFKSEGPRYIPVGELIHLAMKNNLGQESVHLALCLYIDDIAGVKFGIEDKRLLYSLEKRVTNQFLNLDVASGSGSVKAPSLYPMMFVHDMSFWENDELEFDETEFCNVIRNIADDVVVNVELIDRYIDPETEKQSRCYRMTFQSSDKALCYETSWKLQSLIRLEVEKCLKIILR